MIQSRTRIFHFLLLLLSIHTLACSERGEKISTAAWKMHIIDNTSFGSDGTKVTDVNGDGFVDIICGWEQGNIARLYINPGSQGPWRYIEVPAPDVEDAMAVDIDGDSFKDIITFSEGNHKRITFHWAPKNGNYLDSNQWQSQDVPCTIDLTQWMFGQPMNIDDRNGIDIVVVAKNDNALVGWLQSPENPRDLDAWKLHTIAPASWVMSVEILDINHDSQPDILISDRNNNTNGVKWFQHPGFNSAGLYDPWAEHLIGMKERDPMFFDVVKSDSSGLFEIWVPDLHLELFHFVQLDSSGHNWSSEILPFPGESGLIGKSASIGDIDGDGQIDLVTTYDGARDRLGVMWSNFDPISNQWKHYNISGTDGNKYDFSRLLDMDSDGDLDVLTSEENNNSSTVAGLGVIWYENPLGRKETKRPVE